MSPKWSVSAQSMFRRCQREFYFAQVMASHNARDSLRREAHVLKQVQHLEAWQGSVVHQAITNLVVPAIRSGQQPDVEKVVNGALALAERQLCFSAQRHYRLPGMTKTAAGNDFAALYEHEQGLGIPHKRVHQARATIERCLRNLFGRQRFLDRLYAGFGHRSEVPLTFRLNGTTVSAYLDLLYFRGPRQPVIVDWKVAKNVGADYERQLLVYALALLRSPFGLNTRPEDLEVYEANLLQDRIVRYPVTHERLERVEDFVLKGVDGMDALMEGKSYKALALEDFEFARSERSCQHCRFTSLCRGL